MGTLSTAAMNAALLAATNAAITSVTTSLNGGTLRIYSGSVPATPDSALSGNVLLAEATLNDPAFGPAANGVAVANTIASDISADATGVPSFFRLSTSGGTAVFQDTAGASNTALVLSNLSGGNIAEGGEVNITSLTITQGASYA